MPSTRLRALALLYLCAPGASAPAQDINSDFESRVDYAFYTENANGLRNLVKDSAAVIDKSGSTPAAQYQLAYAHFRNGQLFSAKQPSVAVADISMCAAALDAAIRKAPAFAEAYALQAMCFARLASLRTMTAMINGSLSGAKLAHARELSPRNPRVALADGLADLWRPRAFGGDKAAAVVKLRAAIDLFERTEDVPGAPRWGLADAYFALGQHLQDEQDTLAARNALEHALIIAPEYAAARRLLAQVTTPR